MKTLLDIMDKNPAFGELAPELREALVSCASEGSFKAGEEIFTMDSPADECYFIKSGKVVLSVHSPQRGRLDILTVEAGDVLGWSWLFPPYTWHFDAGALDDTAVIKLDAKCVRGKCERDPRLGYALMLCFSQIMLQRLRATRLQLLDIYGNVAT